MVTPTMSLRALPEHHQLIRRMARALIERPDLAASLTALIEGATQGVTQNATRPSPAVDQRIEDIERRLEQLEGSGCVTGRSARCVTCNAACNTGSFAGAPGAPDAGG